MASLKEYLGTKLKLSNTENIRLEFEERNYGSCYFGPGNVSFYYQVLSASCGIALFNDFSGDLTKNQWLELLQIFFARNPQNINKGEFESEFSDFEAGFSHIIFLDVVGRSHLKNLKSLCHASTEEENPNSGSDVVLYTLTRSTYLRLYKEYEAEQRTAEIKATAPKKTYLSNLRSILKRPVPKARRGFGAVRRG